MDFTKKRREWLFWILQVFGWVLSSVSVFILVGELSFNYVLFSFCFSCFIGIFSTSIYRTYLKNNIDIELFGKASINRLIFGFFAVSFFYYFLNFMADELYISFWGITEKEIEFLKEKNGFWMATFGSMTTILMWTVIYFVIKFIFKSNQDRLKSIALNTTLKEAQLNTLKGQVNPHFMFNSLNNIRGLMLEDVEKSREMITKLSEMLEYAVEKNTVDTISIQEELDMVRNYIALSKIQMEDRLQYKENIELDTLPLTIPPMIIQLLVENAAKHGISTLKEGGVINVQINKDSNYLFIIVSNTGKLKLKSNSTQLGLKNIRQRLRLLYGKEARFLLEEKENTVIANIKIPLV